MINQNHKSVNQNNQSINQFVGDQLEQCQPKQTDKPLNSFIDPPLSPSKMRKQTTVGFERAQHQQAQKNIKQMSVLHFQNETIPFSVSLKHFRMYSPGMYLFFNFSKKIVLFFLILMVISLIPVIYNALVGQRFISTKDSLSKYLSVLTIGNLRPYKQAHSSLMDKLMNAIPTFFVSISLFWFYLFWRKVSKREINSLHSFIKIHSYKTVEVIKFPKQMTQNQLQSYMSQFGQVKQISAVKNYQDTIFYCKKIYQIKLNGKEMMLQRQIKQLQTDQKFQKKIQKIQNQLKKLYQKLLKQQQQSSKETIKYYVTFNTSEQRKKTVSTFSPFLKFRLPCFKKKYPQQLKLKGQQVLVRPCHTQPAGIVWQNVHITWKTRWIRLLLQVLLIAILILFGFCFILMLNVLNPPITTSRVDSSMYNQTTIMEVTDKSIIRSWCLNNNDLVQQNPDSDYGQLCQQYLTSTVSRVFISIFIAFGIMVIKYILKFTVLFLSKFMRYKTYTEEAVEMTKNLFLTYFFSTVFITIFMQARFDNFSPKELVKYISSSEDILMNLKEMNDFNDLTNGWYLDVGYQIWVTWFILAITYPLLILTYHYPLEMVCKKLAERQILQRKMEKYLMPEEFQISDHYANLALFIFVGIVFSPGMPSLLMLTGIGLILRYLYFKFVFIRFSRIPKPIDESLNNVILRILIFSLISHLIFAIWMYGVDDMFDHEDSFLHHNLYNDNNSSFQRFWLIVIKRGVDSWYLTILLIFYLIYFLLWGYIKDLYKFCTIGKFDITKASPKMFKDTLGQKGSSIMIRQQRSLTKSYKIENNPDYFEILATKQRLKLPQDVRYKIAF